MSKPNFVKEIATLSKELPLEVLEDINKRVGDWLASGGEESDPYIEQQLRYAKRVINHQNNQ